MEKEFVLVKKNVEVMGVTGNNSPLIPVGIYYLESLKYLFPFINFGKVEYFSFFKKEVFDIGTKVSYNGKKYYVNSIHDSCFSNNYPGGLKLRSLSKLSRKKTISEDDFEIYYSLATGLNTREKDHIKVSSNNINSVSIYYFVTSSGKIGEACYGDDPEADDWREMTRNIFSSKDEARNAIFKIKSKFRLDSVETKE